MATPARTIRGIRDTIPTGYVLGRTGSVDGRAQLLAIKDLGNALVGTGVVPSVPAVVAAAGSSGRPADFVVFWSGKTAANTIFAQFEMTKAITLPINLTGSKFSARVAATSNYVVTINQNGTPIGTITFASGSVTSSFTGAVALAIGDVLQFAGQTSADSTLADISLAFAATFT